MKTFLTRLIFVCVSVCVLCGIFVWWGQSDEQDPELVTYIAEAEKIVDGVTRQKNLYDEWGNLTDIIEYDDNGNESSREYWRYSQTDNVLEAGVYYNGELSYKDVYTYDENDRLIEKWRYNKDGSKKLTVKNTYDENGNLVEKQSPKNRTVSVYNYRNQLVQIIYYDGDRELFYVTYEYNSKGEEIKWERFADGVCEGYGFYEYDKNGNKTKQSTYENGQLVTELEYTYNDFGKVTESKQYFRSGKTIRHERRYNGDGEEVYYAEFANDVEVKRREKVFDINGNRIELREYTNGIIVRELTCEFHENNECKKKVEIWYKDGKEDYCYTYTYNEKGDELTYTYNKKDSGYTSHTEYVYNKKGLLDKKITKKGSEAATVSSEFEYDKNGNMIRSIYYYSKSSEENLYKYDSDGNRIEHERRTSDGKVYVTKYIPLEITQKKINDIDKKLNGEIQF